MKTLTIKGKTDGFGSQYHAIISGIIFCKYNNLEYIHTPFEIMDHNSNINSLNKFIGIPYSTNVNNIDLIYDQIDEIILTDSPDKYYTLEIMKIIKKYYYSIEKPLVNIDIAIHIRRGDVNINNEYNWKNRGTSNLYYVKIINFLKKKFNNRKITIFSEGNINDFKEIKDLNIEFCLNAPIEYTFHCLVKSNILIICKSAFSYVAGLLNDNMIFYIDKNSWLSSLKHWEDINLFLENF